MTGTEGTPMSNPHELVYEDRNGERCASITPDALDEEALRKLVRGLVTGELTGRPHVILRYPGGLVTLVSKRDFDLDYRHAAAAGAQT